MVNIEELEKLPMKMSRKEFITEQYGDMWDLKKFDHSWYRSNKADYYWVKLDRILKSYIGKNVDEAYSKYCKVVETYEKRYFFEEFRNNKWYDSTYTIDLNRCIQLNPDRWQKKKKPYVFRSFDFAYGYYDTKTKEYVSESKFNWRYEIDNDRYIYCVISGYEKTFESKQDPEYKRLKAEKVKAQKLHKKALKKKAKEKEYCFLTEKEIALKKSKEIDILTRNRKGFDDESFKGLYYHGQKRKLK